MNDKPIQPITPVKRVKAFKKLGIPRKPTPKMLSQWQRALNKSNQNKDDS